MKWPFISKLLDGGKQFYHKALLELPLLLKVATAMVALPLVFISYGTYQKYRHLNDLEEKIITVERKAKKTFLSRVREASFIKQLEDADPEFISKYFEPLVFLQKERQDLAVLLTSEEFKESDFLSLRKEDLDNNKVQFETEPLYEKDNLQELRLTVQGTLQMDVEDLQGFFKLLEGEEFATSRPQILIEHMVIRKKEVTSNYSVLEISGSFLERKLKKKKAHEKK
ncbi:MAG: hypothetical protein FJZ63_03335 [Chlamydiae bacterium]|nr:hypothetical protein [Chlamydiota bacterium]